MVVPTIQKYECVIRGAGNEIRSGIWLAYGILPGEGRILQSLNLKNPRAYLLASELAHLTGQTLTAVVISALEHRLEAERLKRGRGTTAQKILAFAERFAPGMAPGSRSEDHAAELYGADGMPR